ncbi:MAG: hypothetical protein RRY24_06750 [Clostridiales bacterium]
MFELPSVVQWKTLFGISEKLRIMEPWKHYKNTEIITIKNKNSEEPLFCSISGTQDECCGISVYNGYQSLSGLFNILRAGIDPPFHTVIGNQQCLTAYFGEKKLMGQGDFGAMEYCEYVPRTGLMNQIFFRTYEPGLAPWYIDAQESQILIDALESLYQGLKKAENQNLSMHKGETLLITQVDYDNYELSLTPLPSFTLEEKVLEIKDELYIAKLKKLPRTSLAMEVDLAYLTNPVAGKLSARPIFPRIIIVANHDEGTVENQIILDEEANEVDELLTFLTDSFREIGRPRLLIIRKEGIKNRISDLCKKINVPIEERSNLEIIDDFLGLVGNYHPEK